MAEIAAAVVVPFAVAGVKEGVLRITTPAKILKNTVRNVDESHAIISQSDCAGMPEWTANNLFEECHEIKDLVDQRIAAGDKKFKNMHKPEVWASARQLESRSKTLKADSIRSSQLAAEQRAKARYEKERRLAVLAEQLPVEEIRHSSLEDSTPHTVQNPLIEVPTMQGDLAPPSGNNNSVVIQPPIAEREQPETEEQPEASTSSRSEVSDTLNLGKRLKYRASKTKIGLVPNGSKASWKDGKCEKVPMKKYATVT